MLKFHSIISTIFTLLFLLNFQYGSISFAQQINLFSDHFHQGNSSTLDISNCSNVVKGWEDQVTSVDTKNFCARFYTGQNCTGESIEMMARSPSHAHLGDWNFNDKMVSGGKCRDECSVNVTGPIPPKEGVNVTVFDRPNYQGATQVITVKGCTIIPRKLNYRVLSVNTTSTEHCFQLYNNVECKFDLKKRYDSIELRHGTPFHTDIGRWHISPVKAISHCSYKCNKTHSDSAPNLNSTEPENATQVILYDEPKYAGNYLLINIGEIGNKSECVNLDQFNGWEGAANSIKLHSNKNDSCVILHAEPNCSDSNHFGLMLHASLEDLATKKFDSVTRSIQKCPEGSDGKLVVSKVGAQGSKASGMGWFSIVALVAGIIVGVFLLLLVVGKWWYPDMRVGRMLNIFRRNDLSGSDWSALRL